MEDTFCSAIVQSAPFTDTGLWTHGGGSGTCASGYQIVTGMIGESRLH
jgi:hypothetical protein